MPVSSNNATSTAALAGSQRRPPPLAAGVPEPGRGADPDAGTRGMSVVLAAAMAGTGESVKPSPDRSTFAWSGDRTVRIALAWATVQDRSYVASSRAAVSRVFGSG